ncbi:MAG: peptidoglycan DD-metalloendopeptidase family protein [bacterium]|nr:peptidoglycan DD-metalloendopeptidase family protein [bacterium]
MKLSKDYKKLYNYQKIILILFIVLFIFFYVLKIASAQSADELQNKIETKNKEIEKLEQDIKSYQSQLYNIGQQKNTLSSSLKQLDLTKKKLTADISITQSKIDKTNLQIQKLGGEINNKETSISNHSDAVVSNIKKLAEYENENITELLLKTEKLTSVWNDLDNMATLREQIRKAIVELKIRKGNLEDDRDDTIIAKNELTRLKNQLADQKKIVEQNVAEKNKLLKQTKNNEVTYQKILKQNLAKKEAFEKELRDYESALRFILDPNSLPNAHVLSWPLDNVFVTQLFGKTSAAKRLYASGSHSGVDFRASVGTPVYAMADGVVLGTGDTDSTCAGASFGKWVYIEYNNGLGSTYGHLSLIKAYQGQKVSRGDIVAYSGDSGHVTGPHLHVTIYASKAVAIKSLPSKSCPGNSLYQPFAAVNAYLDPMIYLPKY